MREKMADSEFVNTEHLEIHRDVAVIAKMVWALVAFGFLAGVWATSLAGDVSANTDELQKKATTEQVATVLQTLNRLESKIDKSDERQRAMQRAITRLEAHEERREAEEEEE